MSSSPEGLTITFQGKVCSPVFSYTRPVGLSPGSGYVHLHRAAFQEFKIVENVPGLDAVNTSGGDTVSKPTGQVERGFLSAGTLVFEEVIDGVSRKVTWEQVLVSENAVEVPFAFDDEDDLVRVEITDIRALYAKRGIVSASINVPMQKTQGPSSAAGTGGSATTQEKTNLPPFTPDSTNGGTPWTLEETLVRKVLPNLPGSPRLKRLPPGVGAANPIGHVWDGEWAVDCLRALMNEFRLEFALNLDASVSFWKKGEGKIQDADGTEIQIGLEDGTRTQNVDPRVMSARPRVAYKHTPVAALVLGSPTIEGFKIDLEPVGEVDGVLYGLKDALEKIGLTVEVAEALAVLPSGRQDAVITDTLLRLAGQTAGAESISPEKSLTEFRRWAFKWFRLPGGMEKNRDKLPILAKRARAATSGELDNAVVSSEGHGFSKSAYLIELAANRPDLFAAGGGAGTGGASAEAQGFAAVAASADQLLVGFNRAYAVQANGYSIDKDRGLVMFDAPQGLLEETGKGHETSRLKGDRNARVTLEACFVRKLSQGYKHRYHVGYVRGAPGAAPSRVEEIPDGVAALLIVRKDLQEIVDADGKSNRADLDAVAEKVATEALSVPNTVVGASVKFCRPVDVVNTGQVLSVTWSTDGGRPRVVAEIGAFAAFAADPQGSYLPPLRTRERPASLDSPAVAQGIRRG